MGQKTKNIHATEIYYNKADITKLLNTDTEREDYPQDDNQYMNTEEVIKLKGLLKGSKYNSERDYYEKKICFRKKKYGDIEYGRLIADKFSLQNAWKPVREFMFDGKVIGFDMTNSQPNILLQLCQKYASNETFPFLSRYFHHRDEVRRELQDYYKVPMKTIKTIMISLCFGATIKTVYEDHQLPSNDFLNGFHQDTTKIKDKICHLFHDYDKSLKVYNYRKDNGLLKNNSTEQNSAIAMYLQNIEGDIMLTIYDAIKSDEDIKVACVIHDEICFENNDYVANNKQQIMCKMQEAVRDKLGFSIKLHDEPYIKNEDFVKRHEEFLKTEEEYEDIPDDKRNAQAFYEVMKDKVISTKLQGNFMYDDERGLWVYDQRDIKKIFYRHDDIFFSTKKNKDGKVVKNNWRLLGSMYNQIMEKFWAMVDYTEELEPDNSRGYLLFKNGVLDCYNFEMLPFDPKYNFTKCINHNFDVSKDYTENMKLIREKIFETAYTDGDGNFEKMDYFMEILSVALMEGGVDKRYLTMLGETNSGKGVLTALLRKSFDEFVSTFNTSVLLQGANANLEDASKWRFLTKCYDSRIMIGNEIAVERQDTTDAFGHKKRTEKGLNVDMMKMLVSGGDSIEARRLRENEITIVNRAFVLMLANDMPLTKADPAFQKRTLILEALRSSTTEDTYDEKEFFKADEDIKDWIAKVEIRDAFIALMCQVYKEKKYNRTKVPEWMTETVKSYVQHNKAFDWVKENYDIYDGNVVKDFEVSKGKQYYTVNWKKVCYKQDSETFDWSVRADIMFDLYKDGGGTHSMTKFKKVLSENGIITARKSSNGITKEYYIGVARVEDDDDKKNNHPEWRDRSHDLDTRGKPKEPWVVVK